MTKSQRAEVFSKHFNENLIDYVAKSPGSHIGIKHYPDGSTSEYFETQAERDIWLSITVRCCSGAPDPKAPKPPNDPCLDPPPSIPNPFVPETVYISVEYDGQDTQLIRPFKTPILHGQPTAYQTSNELLLWLDDPSVKERDRSARHRWADIAIDIIESQLPIEERWDETNTSQQVSPDFEERIAALADTHIPCFEWWSHSVYSPREVILNDGGTEFVTGAVRSADKAGVMYHLISPIGLRRIAETHKEGFDKYGAFNWEKGMPIGDILNHAIAHIFDYLASPDPSTRSEDDLAHAAWNIIAAMHMEETHPHLDHQLRNKPCTSQNPQVQCGPVPTSEELPSL